MYVTKLIHDLYDEAENQYDTRTMRFLDWFITEQSEEEHNAKDLIENSDLMKEGQIVEMVFQVEGEDERVLTCELPTYVELEVTYTEPAVKGDTSTNALKEVVLETGAKIMAPLFINTGEVIRVNTTDRSYGERVK